MDLQGAGLSRPAVACDRKWTGPEADVEVVVVAAEGQEGLEEPGTPPQGLDSLRRLSQGISWTMHLGTLATLKIGGRSLWHNGVDMRLMDG